MSLLPRWFFYEIQHIFPHQIFSSKSNAALNAILNGPEAIKNMYVKAGFGFNRHDSQSSGGNHPGYNQFLIDALSACRVMPIRPWGICKAFALRP